jgi:hypothetical protein
MTRFVWFEDRYTNMAVQRGRLDAGSESAYGVRCLLPSLWAEASAVEQESQSELPSFTLNRRFRIAEMTPGWSGKVNLVVEAPCRYRYSFRGRPLEPAVPAVADAPALPFGQRVEVDGEFSVRMYQVAADGQALTVPGSVAAYSLRRSGARQGRWEAHRRTGQSRWEEAWDETGADDLFTVNSDETRSPAVVRYVEELLLPLSHPDAAFGVELALNGLVVWVKQSGFHGSVRGGLDTTGGGFQISLEPVVE